MMRLVVYRLMGLKIYVQKPTDCFCSSLCTWYVDDYPYRNETLFLFFCASAFGGIRKIMSCCFARKLRMKRYIVRLSVI